MTKETTVSKRSGTPKAAKKTSTKKVSAPKSTASRASRVAKQSRPIEKQATKMNLKSSSGTHEHLNAPAFGLAFGIVWGGALFLLAIAAMLTMPKMTAIGVFVSHLGQLYSGYQASLSGALIGFFWGLVDMGLFGLAIAYIYNKLCCFCACRSLK